jgi:hypothetical protein
VTSQARRRGKPGSDGASPYPELRPPQSGPDRAAQHQQPCHATDGRRSPYPDLHFSFFWRIDVAWLASGRSENISQLTLFERAPEICVEIVKQMPDDLMAAIKADRVRGLQLMHPLRKVALGGRRDQTKMTLHRYNNTLSLCSALRLQRDSPEFLGRSDLPVIPVFDDRSLLDYGSGNGGWM